MLNMVNSYLLLIFNSFCANVSIRTTWKMLKYRVFSVLYFLVCGELLHKSLNSVQIQENVDQKTQHLDTPDADFQNREYWNKMKNLYERVDLSTAKADIANEGTYNVLH